MKQIEVLARSEEQAIQKAAERLQLPEEDLHIIEEYDPDDKDLAQLEQEEEGIPEEQRQGEPVLYIIQVSLSRTIAAIREWTDGMLAHFQVDAHCTVKPGSGGLRVVIEADDPSIFIGKQGHTLAAFQHVLTRVGPLLVPDCPQLFLDVGDYRDRKGHQLERIARQAVQRALRSRKSVALPPMPSTDRKYIHNYLKNRTDISTSSHGAEPKRHVTVEPVGGGGGNRRGGGSGKRGRGDSQRETQPPLPPGVDAADMTAGGLRELQRREELLRRQSSQVVQVKSAPGNEEEDFSDVHIEEHGTRLPQWKEKGDAKDPNSEAFVDELE